LTFLVAALLLLLVTPFVLMRTPTDIFPSINIPVVSVIWSYTGLSAKEIEQRMVYTHERALTTTVNNIEHIESTSYDGVGVIKVFFQQGTSPDAGVAQVTAVSQTILRQLPPGTTPPLIIQYNASSVPILQYGISSKTMNEQQIGDVSLNQIRVGLISVPGSAVPYPYGGKQRLVSVDLDMKALESKNLSSQDVVTAISNQNIVFPSGNAKIGAKQYPVDVNTSPALIDYLNELPIKTVEGAVIRVRDVAHVRDGNDPQQNIVRQDGLRSTLLTVLKNGAASTLAVADGTKRAMAATLKTLISEDVTVKEFLDQSLFVRAAISGVVREGVIAATLTALMILLFLGSWRSTIIIAISIPLAVLASIATLSALGETINLMTLGGLALAVGILVDDATVEIENIHRNLAMGKDCGRRSWMARSRSPPPRSFPRSASASFSCRCFFSPVSRGFSSCRWRRRWCSRSSLRICSPARSYPRWSCGSRTITSARTPRERSRPPDGRGRSWPCTRASSAASRTFAISTATCSPRC
jgi:multidrug efflux pump subunit AcrB